MTESEWFQCVNPHLMLEHLAKTKEASRLPLLSWLSFRRKKDASRQSVLFAIACCRRIENLLVDLRSRNALDIAEKLADGKAGRNERRLAIESANAAAFDASGPAVGVGGWLAAAQARAAEAVAATLAELDPANVAAARAKDAVRAQAKARPNPQVGPASTPSSMSISWNSAVSIPSSGGTVPSEVAAWTNEANIQCDYLRDIFGNPFHPTKTNRQDLQKSEAIMVARRIYDERTFYRLPELADVLAGEGIGNPELLAHCRQPGNHVRGCWVIDLLLGY